MRVTWLGHACFLLSSDAGTRIIVDPYSVRGGLNYGEIDEAADVVLSSHDHYDHSNTAAVKGHPVVLRSAETAEVKGITFKGVPAYHDDVKGTKRGANIIFAFTVDGIRLCHLGDLGHDMGDVELKTIGKVDVLFIPVGGLYTLEVAEANRVCDRLAPRVVIPMHFKTSKVDTALFGAIGGLDDFLKGKAGVERRDSSEVEFDAGDLPVSTRIVVLKPAR
jgi:L-ascorbate metabolism protein UlaG (beta-lactamase superfamily)